MNFFVYDDIFAETDEDENYIKSHTLELKLNRTVVLGENYFKDKNKIDDTNKMVYIVKPLDTIKRIANKLNKTEDEVKRLVGGKTVFVGQKIYY